jgi:hypothetical protein
MLLVGRCHFCHVGLTPITGPRAREVLRRGGSSEVHRKGGEGRSPSNRNLRLTLIHVKNEPCWLRVVFLHGELVRL